MDSQSLHLCLQLILGIEKFCIPLVHSAICIQLKKLKNSQTKFLMMTAAIHARFYQSSPSLSAIADSMAQFL